MNELICNVSWRDGRVEDAEEVDPLYDPEKLFMVLCMRHCHLRSHLRKSRVLAPVSREGGFIGRSARVLPSGDMRLTRSGCRME